MLGRLIRLLGVERGLTDKAAEVLTQAEEVIKGTKMDEDTLAAYRRAVIAGGDVSLWHGKLDAALELYRRAEKLGHFIPMQVRAARVGATRGRSEISPVTATMEPPSTWCKSGKILSRPIR